jgi:hypothetical protein
MESRLVLISFGRSPCHVNDDKSAEEEDDREREKNESHGIGRVTNLTPKHSKRLSVQPRGIPSGIPVAL